MQRKISVVAFDEDGLDWHPNYLVSQALGLRLDRRLHGDTIVMDGCGYDAGAEIVSNLSRVLGYSLSHRWL